MYFKSRFTRLMSVFEKSP